MGPKLPAGYLSEIYFERKNSFGENKMSCGSKLLSGYQWDIQLEHIKDIGVKKPEYRIVNYLVDI